MTETIKRKLSDSAAMRWLALFLVASAMLMAYFLEEVMDPLQFMLEANGIMQGSSPDQWVQGMGWSATEFGFFAGAYGYWNVFLLMLFFGGIILDKMGIRFTSTLSTALMVGGAFIKYYAIAFMDPTVTVSLVGWTVKLQVVVASVGFSIFGVGCETTGITVSKVITKWFTGHELALAMGIEMALARLGSAAALTLAPIVAYHFHKISTPILFGAVLLLIGMINFIVYNIFMDKKLDSQLSSDELAAQGASEDDQFHFSDLKLIFTNPGFWLITLLCLLFYSAIFPFLKFSTKIMIDKYGFDGGIAGMIPSIIPLGTMALTPLFGIVYDKVGKGATLMLIGAAMLLGVYVVLAMPDLTQGWVAITMMFVMGIAFSLVPSAMWPSVPKIIPFKLLGTAYAVIFWIQNIGLSLVPLLLGAVIDASTTEVAGKEVIDYTPTMLIFCTFGVCSVLLAIGLKAVNAKKGYGLEDANMK